MIFQLAMILAEAPAKPEAQEGPGPLGIMMPLLLMFVVFYFFMILPNRRQKQQQEQLLASLKKNDEVVTHAGILGTVANIKDTGEEVTLKIDDNVRMRVLRSSIARILTPREPAKDAASAEKPESK